MALARIKSIEHLRYCAPGEWGKLLGLDRIPEARTLREKVKYLSQNSQVEAWGAELCNSWMQASQEFFTAYVDGHVRVYNGSQTKLPKHYVTREKLCLRATVDYWVNAMDGQPFFYINKAVDPGLINVMEHEIVPRIEQELAPIDPDKLIANPLVHKFTLIFDREGYSPDLMKRMKARRIACITYNKFPKENWLNEEFTIHTVKTVAGNKMEVLLAERGVLLSNNLWIREIRRLNINGHQTSILSTDYSSNLNVIAAEISDRWNQENYFKYMRENYNLDKLVEYSTEEIDDTTVVVNPEHRRLDGEVRKLAATHSRRLAEFGAIHLEGNLEPNEVDAYEKKKAQLQEELNELYANLQIKKADRKQVGRHIKISELPEEDRFRKLATTAKSFLDTIKMIAYRAETANVNVMRETMAKTNEARSLLRAVYQTEADLIPNHSNQTLTIRLHHLANHASDQIMRHLCDEINATETTFPGTNMRLIYEIGSNLKSTG